MFDPSHFDNEIFDTPAEAAPFHFGRAGRKFERRLFNRVSFSIQIVGIAMRAARAVLSVRGAPFINQAAQLPILGTAYRLLNKRAEIKRKRRFTMLDIEVIET